MQIDWSKLEEGLESYWAEIRTRSPANQEREEDFANWAGRYASRTPPRFVLSDLEALMAWKHTDARWRDRAVRGLREASPEELERRTSQIAEVDDPIAAFQLLKGMARGVGIAGISAILSAARPDRFPVIDVFALMTLIELLPEPWHARLKFDDKGRPVADESVWADYVMACRRIAVARKAEGRSVWSVRDVDMALWGAGKQLASPVTGSPRTSANPEPLPTQDVLPVPSVTVAPGSGRLLTGRVRDIQPNGHERRWEMYFDKEQFAGDFPREHQSWIAIEWPQGVFRSRVGLKPANPIYFWSGAEPIDGGPKTRVTDLLEELGLGCVGEVQLEVVEPRRRYRFVTG